jgi:hypothetical protein
MARLAFAIAAGLALGGCCHNNGSYVPTSNARAEFGPLPKPHPVKRARSRPTSNTTVSSKDTSPGEEEFSKLDPEAADDRLRKKLVICRGCAEPAPDDQVSAIWPTRAAEGYLSIQKTLRSLSLPVEVTSSGGLR